MLNTINRFYRTPEKDIIQRLLSEIAFSKTQDKTIQKHARYLVERVRQSHHEKKGIDKLMTKYELSSKEGLALMALAESLIRVPDQATAYALIQDKLKDIQFDLGIEKDDSFTEKAASKLLSFASQFLSPSHHKVLSPLKTGLQKASQPVAVLTAKTSLNHLANQFVMGSCIEHAYQTVPENRQKGYSYSFDMLGEAAHTRTDAKRYFDSYLKAIQDIGQRESSTSKSPDQKRRTSSISVKLSALHPRYEITQKDRSIPELTATVKTLCLAAYHNDIDLTIDAEESERLELSLEILSRLASDPDLTQWDGLGMAVQAYQKRAVDVIDYLQEVAKTSKRQLKVRLVKGAYWDSEIKEAQVLGLRDYPVFTRKQSTDLSYLVCAKKLLAHPREFLPQFATHNAHTVAAILELAKGQTHYEFQCLYGMGEALYDELLSGDLPLAPEIPVRIYAPIGDFKDLLPYLVRRLLENGANTSFVNEITKPNLSIDDLIADPIQEIRHLDPNEIHNPHILRPENILPGRINSSGYDLSDQDDLDLIYQAQRKLTKLAASQNLSGHPLINGKAILHKNPKVALNPATFKAIGTNCVTDERLLKGALESASTAHKSWNATPVDQRAHALETLATLLESQKTELMALLSLEAGKSIPDALDEVREAVDFCRYYATQAREKFTNPVNLPGPTGETNTLSYSGRGPFLCISPWNFPLAIFVGQIAAALVSGNPVLAKPASQTTITATHAVALMHKAGIPTDVLQLIPASGKTIGDNLLPDPRIAGVCFTGSSSTARQINQILAHREGAIIPFIAETGGQNAMIVDSTALPEQVVSDVIASAFQSAGQRCSALRLLCLQDDIADKVIEMLTGAMDLLVVGDPKDITTDVGPVIDKAALTSLQDHCADLKGYAKEIHTTFVPQAILESGYYCPPTAYELSNLDHLTTEHFGPILHIMRFRAQDLLSLVDNINHLGFGLTFGLHTRIQGRVDEIANRIDVGNMYVNRNMIGAVVGVQPFGGQGLSGTGPKAGGPNYLMNFVHEKTISINTTAQGGNTTLMSLGK